MFETQRIYNLKIYRNISWGAIYSNKILNVTNEKNLQKSSNDKLVTFWGVRRQIK